MTHQGRAAEGRPGFFLLRKEETDSANHRA